MSIGVYISRQSLAVLNIHGRQQLKQQ